MADLRRFIAMAQAAVGHADPVNYAPATLVAAPPGHLRPHVLMQEVMDDGVVPNSSTEALARSFDIPLIPPVIEPIEGLWIEHPPPVVNTAYGVTAGIFQIDRVLVEGELKPANHSNIDHNVVSVEQWRHFLATALAGHPAEIIDPYEVLGLP